jgi:hypothetical protein
MSTEITLGALEPTVVVQDQVEASDTLPLEVVAPVPVLLAPEEPSALTPDLSAGSPTLEEGATRDRSPSPSFRRRLGSPQQRAAPYSPRRAKGVRDICRNFLRGACHRGDICNYYHPQQTFYNEPQAPPPPRGGPRDICRDFARGDCPRGARCIFSHETQSREICRDFQRSSCTRPSCNFLHEPLDHRTASPLRDDDFGRKRPRFEYEPPRSPLRSIASSELSYLLSLKEEVLILQDENLFLRDRVQYLQNELDRFAPPPVERSSMERRGSRHPY